MKTAFIPKPAGPLSAFLPPAPERRAALAEPPQDTPAVSLTLYTVIGADGKELCNTLHLAEAIGFYRTWIKRHQDARIVTRSAMPDNATAKRFDPAEEISKMDARDASLDNNAAGDAPDPPTAEPAAAAVLPVHIMDGEKLVRVVDIPDPRVVFCRKFNATEIGHTAVILSEQEIAYLELDAMLETIDDEPTDVWLVDPRGESDPALAFQAKSLRHAQVWRREWKREDGLGLQVVFTPPGERPDGKGGAA